MKTPLKTRVVVSIVVIAIALIADSAQDILRHFAFYKLLYARFPYYVPETLRTFFQLALCLGTVWVLAARDSRRTANVFGVAAKPWSVVSAMFIASLPMFVGFAFTRHLANDLNAREVAFLSIWSPVSEEIIYRGFLFAALCRFGGWSFWPAALLNAAIFGYGHVEHGANYKEMAGLLLLAGAGGILFCWLFLRWGENLWAPAALHAFMNLSWQIFDTANNALGGWFAFCLQVTTAALAVLVTMRLKRSPRAKVQARSANPSVLF